MSEPAPESKIIKTHSRFILWVKGHQQLARLGSLTTVLVIFLIILPISMRIVFWEGLKSRPILASMLIVFSFLALSLLWSAGKRLDAWIFLSLNFRGSRSIWLDRIMLGLTQIGNGLTALAIGLVLLLAGERLLAYELILGALTLWLVVEVIKFLVHRSRPFIHLTQTRIVGNPATGRSFPSGHTSLAFFMATLISQHFHFGFEFVILLYAAAFLVGITRMYVGAHYPRDVLAGAILGSAWGLLVLIVDEYVLNW